MIEKASIYTMNALNKLSELWHTSINHKARPVVEGEHDKSWNDHGSDFNLIKQVETCLIRPGLTDSIFHANLVSLGPLWEIKNEEIIAHKTNEKQ